MATATKLTDTEVAARLPALPGWTLVAGKLHKAFAFRDFVEAWGFMSAVALAAFVTDVLVRHKGLDVLVNTVGGFAGGDLASTSLAEWRRMIDLNLTSAVIGCRAVLPAMRAARRGRIVNVSSRAVVAPAGGFIAYTVGKSAVIALTQALAQEERPHGIAVNAVLPSTMDTPANRRAMPDADRSGWVSTEAVADVIAYLASDRVGAVSGGCIPV